MDDLDALALNRTCGYCAAGPDQWCVTARGYSRPPGQRAPRLHEARLRDLREAWRVGHGYGWDAALNSVASHLEAARQGARWVRDEVPRLTTDAVERWLLSWRESRRG